MHTVRFMAECLVAAFLVSIAVYRRELLFEAGVFGLLFMIWNRLAAHFPLTK